MSTLTIRCYDVKEVRSASFNGVSKDGVVSVDLSSAARFIADEPAIKSASIRILPPNKRDVYSDTVMDVIPISAKALGKLGDGVTNTLTGMYVMLTGADEEGRQMTNGGGTEGILRDHVEWGRPGTPELTDWLIMFDIIAAKGAWAERRAANAPFRACDRFCAELRADVKRLSPYSASEAHRYCDDVDPRLPSVVILKEVSGQGAIYDTALFPHEPCGFEGSTSIIDMGNMPVFLTPNEYRDGAVRALD